MDSSTRETVKGVFLILTAAVLWGAVGPVAKVAFAEGIEPLTVAFWRAVIGWLFFATHAALRRSLRIPKRDIPVMVIFALVSVSGFFGSYQLAIRFGGAAQAAVLLYTAPAWVAIMAAIFLRESMGIRTVLSIVLAVTGVALISLAKAEGVRLASFFAFMGLPLGASGGGTHSLGWAGLVFGLVAGITYALYYIIGRRLLERYSPLTVFAWILIIGAGGLLPFVSLSVPSLRSILPLLSIGLISTYGAYLSYSAGLVRLRSSQASVIATIEPVVAAVLAYLFWDENLGIAGYIGATFVLTGVILQSTVPAASRPVYKRLLR
jgi:DME family drug/metabolite transporter